MVVAAAPHHCVEYLPACHLSFLSPDKPTSAILYFISVLRFPTGTIKGLECTQWTRLEIGKQQWWYLQLNKSVRSSAVELRPSAHSSLVDVSEEYNSARD